MPHEQGSLLWAALYAQEKQVFVFLGTKGAYWNTVKLALLWISTDWYVCATSVNLTGWTIKAPAPEPTVTTEYFGYDAAMRDLRVGRQVAAVKGGSVHFSEGDMTWPGGARVSGAERMLFQHEPEPEALDYTHAAAASHRREIVEVRDTEPSPGPWARVQHEDGGVRLYWDDGAVVPLDAHMEFRIRPKHEPAPEPETEDVPIRDFILARRSARAGSRREEADFELRIKCYLYPDNTGGFEEVCTPLAYKITAPGKGFCIRAAAGYIGNWAQATHVQMLKGTDR